MRTPRLCQRRGKPARLPDERVRFPDAIGKRDGRMARANMVDRAVAQDGGSVELQVVVDRCTRDRRQVENAAHGQAAADRMVGRAVGGPIGQRQHGREMSAGRMAADHESGRVSVEVGRPRPYPQNSPAGLVEDGVERHLRREVVFHHERGRTRRTARLSEEAVVLLAMGPPVSAMEEDMDRRSRPLGRKHVDAFAWAGTISKIDDASASGQHPLALAHVARQDRFPVRVTPAEIVFPLQRHGTATR